MINTEEWEAFIKAHNLHPFDSSSVNKQEETLNKEVALMIFSTFHLGHLSESKAMELLGLKDYTTFKDLYIVFKSRTHNYNKPQYSNLSGFKSILQRIADNEGSYTHSEIIAFSAALEEIRPTEFSSELMNLIDGLIVGLRKFGINHNTRSNIAKIILREVKEWESSIILSKTSYDYF